MGGVAAVAIIVFLVWRFWIKKRREQQELEAEEWEEDDIAQQKQERMHQFNAMMSTDAASTRTRGSLANSILSRASNIIQIAYIPGVTNRNGNGSGHNSLLGNSPVPPIPAARGSQPPKSPLSNEGDALFFRPGDLRDSTYSNTSSMQSGNRDTHYTTRHSITPSLARSSVVSEAYRDDASEMPMPATTVARAAPRMVSIKSSASGSPLDTPGSRTPVNSSDYQDFAANTPGSKGKGIQIMMPGESSSSSPGSLKSSTGSQYGKPKTVTVGGAGNGKSRPARQKSDASTSASTISKHAPAISSPLAEIDDEASDTDSDEHARARQSLINTSLTSATQTPPLVQPVESPFFDASEQPPSSASSSLHSASSRGPNPYATMGRSIGIDDVRPKRGGKGMGGLSDIIEEATRRASRVPSHEGLGGRRDGSPFGDENASE